jgi:hypothetical protein
VSREANLYFYAITAGAYIFSLSMRQLYLFPFLALLGVLVSCKKEVDSPQVFSDKIVLRDPELRADSLALTWSQLDNTAFQGYAVLRRISPTDQGQLLNSSYPALTTTHFTDADVPYAPYVEYEVQGRLAAGQPISSNRVSYQRPEIKTLSVQPFDVQFDRQRRQLYFFDKTGVISQYNLATNQLTKTLNTAATIGYCDFGTYQGVSELYVPRNDGWVFIYNAQTLEKIDQINVGSAAACVVASNGLLFVSTSSTASTYGYYYRPLRVYSRASKNLLSEAGSETSSRFKRVPNTTTDLVELTLNISPVDQHYYGFTASGTPTTNFADRYHGDYPVDASLFEIFPNGSKYITSTAGTIFTKDLVYEASLPKGNLTFTSFDFDAAGQAIYAGTTTKSVEIYATNGYTHQRSLKTKAYPYRIFQDGSNGVLCISSVTPVGSSSYYYNNVIPTQVVIEQLR